MTGIFVPFARAALERSIPERFFDQVARHPDRTAIRTREASITYRELGRKVERIARAILGRRGPAVEPVALLLEQGAALVAAALGVLASGKFYVPLDPAHPRAHLREMLQDLGPCAALTDRRHREQASQLFEDAEGVLTLEDIDAADLTAAPLPAAAADALAYVHFTSGSTGRAKGVMDTHRNVLHNVMRYTNSLRITADDRLTLLLPASSSGAVSDVFGALLNGAALFPVDLHHQDLAGLAAWINREQLTICHSAPAIFRHIALSAPALPSLRVVRLEGDTASPRDVDLFRTRCAADSALVNGLGLTECGLVRQYFVTRATPVDASVPVGYPVEDMRVALVDAEGKDVSAGEIGEIVVESRFLAPGYWRRPDLTAERFATVIGEPGLRRYRTGDLGQLRPDGCLLHLGRTDFQPKVRGHRIDTEAIEAALLELADMREAAVVVRADGPDDPRVVAYCVASGTPPPTVGALRRHLAERLPRDLLPAAYVWLDRLPLTDGGKVDRRALPAPGRARPPLDRDVVAPRSPLEATLARHWAEVLGRDEVGVDDDFLDLGGDSLQAVQIVGRIRASFGVDLGVPALFANPSVGAVATIIAAEPATVKGAENAGATIPRLDGPGPFPLSFPQERLYFLCQLDPGEPVYNAPLALRLCGSLVIEALVDALAALVARHETLRTTIQLVDGIPFQRVEPIRPFDLTRVDLTAVPDAGRATELQRRLQAEVRRPFDLGGDPMLRACLFRVAANEHVLLLVLHHIATDGWSEGVFISDLSTLYEAAQFGQMPQLPALPIRYADYASWQRARWTDELRAGELEYWQRRLAGAPASLDLPRGGREGRFGSAVGAIESMDLSSALLDGLFRTSRELEATPFMFLLAAFKAVLRRHTGRDDIVVGTATAGRTQSETQGLVGFFVNMLALRTDLSGDPPFRELVARVRETSLGAYAHQDLPFASLIAEINPERHPGRLPLVQVAFIFEPPLPPFASASLSSEQLAIHTGAAPFELTLFIRRVPAGLRATAEYRTDLYDAPMIVRLLSHFHNVLETAAADPMRRLSELPILSAPERQRALVEWNDTGVDYPRDRCLHQLFEQQVERTPAAVAVTCGEQQLAYGELNARANQLAHHLRALGVGPDVPVGLCLARSSALVIGMLGILKAGGAFVPLDPSYPKERLTFMLDDARAPVLLTEQRLRGRLSTPAMRTLCLDHDGSTVATQPVGNPTGTVSAANLAYVIYTSGSTGTPKGVMIEHRAAVNHMEWMRRTFAFDHRDSVLQKTPISFDAAMWEFFTPLLSGGRLVLAPPDAHRDPTAIVRALREHEVTTVQLVPSLFRLLVQEPLLPACGKLARVFCGGEALPGDVARRFFERSGARLYNLYGPTEACIDSLSWECRRDDAGATVPIGRPIANTRVYVLDEHRQPVPVWVAGELYIGGEGLARGYLGRPELTAERFVADPFAPRPGARMYRSGDRARYRADGAIEFLGRLDHQLKLRGIRIEPGEIEAALTRHAGVTQALVLQREDVPGQQRLVAYVVVHLGTATVADLRASVSRLLPDYMCPSDFVVMDALPLAPNGKIDRAALPRPEARDVGAGPAFVAPRNPVEEELAAIWAGVLGMERVGVDNNFFELGGDSLLAIQALSRLRDRLRIELPVRAFFEAPTIARLAARIAGASLADGHHLVAGRASAPDSA